MADRYADILVVDLLGGIGDLLMVLPVIHGLARRHPGAALRVVTHEPGADLIRGDPAVTQVCTPRHGGPGAEREAVQRALADRRPDLAVTTTRYDGIPALLESSAGRCVTDLWRRPPVDDLVTARYLRILVQEGLLEPADAGRPARVHLSPAERADGARTLAHALPSAASEAPVVLVTDAGMAVKRWPQRHWERFIDLVTGAGHPVLSVTPGGPVPAVAPGGLRGLAARFAATAARGGVVVGGDTGPLRLAAAAGAPTVALFGPTPAGRYGLGERVGAELQGLPGCPHRRPTRITEQICWWDGTCPLSSAGPACMADVSPDAVAGKALALLGRQGEGRLR